MYYLFSEQMIIHNLLTAFNQYLEGFSYSTLRVRQDIPWMIWF